MDTDKHDNSSKEKDTSKKASQEEHPSNKKKFDEMGSLRFSRSQKREKAYEDLFSFVKGNTKDTLAYVLVIAGILMMFFDGVSIYGGLIVGVILGLYFAKELAYLISNTTKVMEEEGLPKSLLFGAFLLLLFVKMPFVVIGAALVAVLKAYFVSEK